MQRSNRYKKISWFLIFLFILGTVNLARPAFFAQAQEQNSGNNTASSTDQNAETPPDKSPQEQRQELENQLAELEKQIEENQKTIEDYQKKGKTLKNEISSLNAKTNKLSLQIKAINLQLSKVNQEINETQRQINRTENKIDGHRGALSQGIRNLYEADTQSIVEVLLVNKRLSDFFGNLNNIALVQNNIRNALIEITKLKQELLAQKEDLSSEKEDVENLKAIRSSEKKNTEVLQNEKNNLLKITKGKETEYQKILQKTKETAAQIRSRIFELIGGGELTFEKAYDYARLAEGASGVRAAFILAILHRESLLGKNTGRCSYKTAMNPKDIPTFLGILDKLNIEPDSTVALVSCPNADGRYGGAMGPAQFIPSTWKIYESEIGRITGNNPPSPWNNSDAFVATSLYLKKFGGDSKRSSDEKRAAAIYYCGSNWQRYACTYYAGKVVETATKFQQDIDLLNSNAGANSNKDS